MNERPTKDLSNGYNAIVDDYIVARSSSGRDLVRDWAERLRAGSSVLDLGAGFGEPVTAALIKSGHQVSAIEASPAMVLEFQQRFPDIRIACEAVENSDFFGETFDAVCAIGLMFLLSEAEQRLLIQSVANVLEPGGAFLFSAPVETGTWEDLLTGRQSTSLGVDAYRRVLGEVGFIALEGRADENGSHYYLTKKA
ncbi:MAG: class I SAM-dependent methyltransferase [Pseudomonadota bacterium]